MADGASAGNAAPQLPARLLSRLREKIQSGTFDAGQSFSLANVEDAGWTPESISLARRLHLEATTPMCLVATAAMAAESDIWPIDHCWSLRYRELEEGPAGHSELSERIERLLGLAAGPVDPEVRAQRIARHAWAKALCIRLSAPSVPPTSGAEGGEQPTGGSGQVLLQDEATWYFLDEVGSALLTPPAGPSADAGNASCLNVAVAYVHFPDLGFTGSAFWPTADIEEGEVVAAPLPEAASYIAALLRADTENVGLDDLSLAFRNYRSADRPSPPAPQAVVPCFTPTDIRRPLTVFTDSELVHGNIVENEARWRAETSQEPPFTVTDSADVADVVWLCHEPLSDGTAFPAALFLNQFPKEEFVFTTKNGLARWIQRRYGRGLSWFADAYDLTKPQDRALFVGHWLQNESRKGESSDPSVRTPNDVDDTANLWIVKPHNMARSMDMIISAELTELLRIGDAGPKLACQYVSNPRTMRRRKFDLRFIVLLSSLEPTLELHLFDEFWIRFAAEEYSLDHFSTYDKHWTVMNYGANKAKMLQMKYYDFITNLNDEMSAECGAKVDVWPATYARIQRMCRDAFAAIQPLDESAAQQKRYRGMYGLDVLLRDCPSELKADPKALQAEGLQPVLLEITYSPDCHRACTYHPTFYYDAFSTLFLGVPKCSTKV